MQADRSVVAILFIVAVLGCGPKPRVEVEPTASGPTKDDRPVEVEVGNPIDRTPEGREYRKATMALDANDLTSAKRIAQELSTSVEHAVLGDALGAFLLIREGKLDQALAIAEKISEVPVMQAESYTIAGEVFLKKRNLVASIDAFRNAVKLDPSHVRCHRWLGALFHDIGAMNLATENLRIVAKLDATDYRCLRFSGMIHREYEHFEESIEDYEAALKRKPPTNVSDEILLEMTDSMIRVRKLMEAKESLQRVTTKSATRFALEAEILEALGQNEQAIRFAQDALEMDAFHIRASLVLSRLFNANRQWEETIQCLKPIVSRNPMEHEPRFLLGRALLSSGRAEEGKACLVEAKRIKDVFLQFAEKHVDAVNRPEDVDIRMQLAVLAEELQKDALALTWYRAVLGLAPDRNEAKLAIQRILAKRNGVVTP